MNRLDLIEFVLPLLYETKTKRKNYARSSYGMKHEVERALNFYITNDELIAAATKLGWTHTTGSPNYTFYVKSKFPGSFFQGSSRTPTDYKFSHLKQTEWDAYKHACTQIDDLIRELTKEDESDSSHFVKLAKKVGYHS